MDCEHNEEIKCKLVSIGVKEEKLAESLIECGFNAIIFDYDKARSLLPRILEILLQMHNYTNVGNAFENISAKIPAWIFLPWINQFMVIMNSPVSRAISNKFIEIAEKYPQLVIYALKVAKSNREIEISEEKKSELYQRMEEIIESNGIMNSWIEALEGLTYPEHRTRYWFDIMKDLFTSEDKRDTRKLEHLLKLCYYDILSLEK